MVTKLYEYTSFVAIAILAVLFALLFILYVISYSIYSILIWMGSSGLEFIGRFTIKIKYVSKM